MRIVKGLVLLFVFVLASIGPSYAQASPQPKQVVKKVRVKPPKPIQNKPIPKADKLVLTPNEKAIQKANKKRIQEQQNALRKANKKAADDFKAMQKVYTKQL